MPVLNPQPFAVRWQRDPSGPVMWYFRWTDWYPAAGTVEIQGTLQPILSGADPEHVWLRGDPSKPVTVETAVDVGLGRGDPKSTWVPVLREPDVVGFDEAGIVRACRLRDGLVQAAA